MRQSVVEKMLEDHGRRISELEARSNEIPIHLQDKSKPELKPNKVSNAPQDKKDEDLSLGNHLGHKAQQGKTTKTEHMPVIVDNHPEVPTPKTPEKEIKNE